MHRKQIFNVFIFKNVRKIKNVKNVKKRDKNKKNIKDVFTSLAVTTVYAARCKISSEFVLQRDSARYKWTFEAINVKKL